MERFKNVVNRIKEFINSFANPIEPEKSFDELAVSAGISEADINMLKKSMGGVTWKFADEMEEPKKGKIKGVTSKQAPIQPTQKINTMERKKGIDRDE